MKDDNFNYNYNWKITTEITLQQKRRYYCKQCRACLLILFLEDRAENEENMNTNDELEATEKSIGAAVLPEIRQFMQHIHNPH